MALRKEWVSQVKDANEVDEHIIIAIAALLTMETALAGDLTTVGAVKANWPDQLLDSLLIDSCPVTTRIGIVSQSVRMLEKALWEAFPRGYIRKKQYVTQLTIAISRMASHNIEEKD